MKDSANRNGEVRRAFLDELAMSWPELDDVARVEELRGLVTPLTPERLIANSFVLSVMYLIDQIPGGARRPMADAYALIPRLELPDPDAEPLAFVAVITAQVRYLARNGRASAAFTIAEHALAVVEAMPASQGQHVQRAMPWLWVDCAYVLCAMGWMRRALPLLIAALQTDGHVFPRFSAAGIASLAFATTGYPGDAGRHVTLARELAIDQAWMDTEPGRFALMAELLIESAHLNLASTDRLLSQMLDVIRRAPQSALVATSSVVQALLALDRASEALKWLEVAANSHEFAGSPPLAQASITYNSALARLSNGQPGFALASTRLTGDEPEHTICFASVRGFCFVAMGLPHLALVETDGCIAMGTSHNLRKHREILVVRAAAHLHLGREGAAADSFAEFLDVTGSSEMSSLTRLPVSVLRALLDVATAHGAHIPSDVRMLATRAPNKLDAVLSRIGALTAMERLVLAELCGELTLDEISTRLFVSRNTVKSHCRSIFQKMDVSSRAAATDFAFSAGFLASVELDE